MIDINEQKLLSKFPSGYPKGVQTIYDLLRYALKKQILKIPLSTLNDEITDLWKNNQITVEQWQTLNACYQGGEYTRIINNRMIKRRIKVK